MRTVRRFLVVFALLLYSVPRHASAQEPSGVGSPKSVQDPKTKVTFYLESDGRHVAAISPQGKILWIRDVIFEAGLKPYRVAHPVIDSFFLDGGSMVHCGTDSSQIIELDRATGKVGIICQF